MRTLFVTQLHASVSEKRLKSVFEKYGPVKRTKIIPYPWKKNCAFVEFEQESDSQDALVDMRFKFFPDKWQWKVCYAHSDDPGKSVVEENVEEVDWQLVPQSSSDSRKALEEDHSSSYSGVTPTSTTSAPSSSSGVTPLPSTFDTFKWPPRPFASISAGFVSDCGGRMRTLFVTQLHASVSEKRLKSVFEKYGPVKRTKIIPYLWKMNCAFVEFERESDSEDALVDMRFKSFLGKWQWKVQYAHSDDAGKSVEEECVEEVYWLLVPRSSSDSRKALEDDHSSSHSGVTPTSTTSAPSSSSGVAPSQSSLPRFKLPPLPLASTTAVDLPHSSPPTSRTTFPAHIKVPEVFSDTLTFGTVGDILHSISCN
ncbi:putative nucleotide-binding alpha-beta plait domain-containing protein [Rosa chinensis]|uniref:Putative nucleotide-binding alpha-beta plait domain-containing protein n=1 Tax=Rosa chinensis TaxID=74649 RepID=A0A2P6QNG7_ROSCH|nr:uncharacterized protein LOC112167766 isoform X2 [Rosa chinensis]PRQ35730.1 putative nucleotide-binding alpha-beta plait domain-containing protein [Rosa chinensis]